MTPITDARIATAQKIASAFLAGRGKTLVRKLPPSPASPELSRERTLEECATILGVTRERVRHIENTAISKLAVFATEQLGHPPTTLEEIASLFEDGPRPADAA